MWVRLKRKEKKEKKRYKGDKDEMKILEKSSTGIYRFIRNNHGSMVDELS